MKYFYVKLSCPKGNDDEKFRELISSLIAHEDHEFHFVNIPNRLTEASPGDMVFVQLGGDANVKRGYFTDPDLQNFENGLYGICKVTEVLINEKEFKGIVYPIESSVTKMDLYLYPQFIDNLGIVTKGIATQAGLYGLSESTAFSFLDYLNQNSLLGNSAKFVETLPYAGVLEAGVSEFMENNNAHEVNSYLSYLNAMGLEKKSNNRIGSEFSARNFLIAEFIKWFSLEENFRKSYEGLVSSEVLKFWDDIYFHGALFDVDPDDHVQSIEIIREKINRLNHDSQKWIMYDRATNKGAPKAVLGENNYLRFLTDFFSNENNRDEVRKNKERTQDVLAIDDAGAFEIESFTQTLNQVGISFKPELPQEAVAGMQAKPFLILTGLSGSGKTKLAQAFSTWICETGDQLRLISVGADWTSNENLLGYPNALEAGNYCKPDNGVLDLILAAQADPEHPYFLILDEMNLSHVERYFADFLSAMESGEAIHLHDDTDADWNGVPAKLTIPKNLFVIGTVNVDETTYMFSPKVLDRANVIEFRVDDDEMESFLANPVKPKLEDLAGQGKGYGKAFVKAATSDVSLDEALRKQVSDVLMTFFPALKEAGAEFGYRSAHEICRFVHFYMELSEGEGDFDAAMDAAVMQKLLPKLHGSKKKLGPVLETLIRLCLKPEARPENDPIKAEVLTKENALYGVSLEKLKRMRQRLAEHGFTSFAEA